MTEKYPPAAMWGLYNWNGYLMRADYSRHNLMQYGAQFWGEPWRNLRRRGVMSIRSVYVVPFVKEATEVER
jgi:hypothetical protein